MTNNLLNKNFIIGALIILLVVTSWWGQSETSDNKRLIDEKEAAEVQLVSVETEATETRQALQESKTALSDAEKKLSQVEENKQNLAKVLSEEQSTVATLKKEKEILLKKNNELEYALTNAKTQQEQNSGQQEDAEKTVVEYKKAQAKLEQAETRIAELEKEQADLQAQADARLAQLQQQQDDAATELESLRAQVIGFEKVVEERNAALTEVSSDLDACKVNTKVLLAKITEQEDAHLGMEEQMRNIVQNFSQDAAQEESPAPEQEKQAADHAE